jgi:glycosyltransferase involved in cell wall biosynthesis
MREPDVLVLPSITTLTSKEQFGLVLFEAMLLGLAVMGSDSGAVPEVIVDAGLAFPEGDADVLAACLRRLNINPVLRGELAERGRRRALGKYSVTVLVKQNCDFFSKLLAENSGIPRIENRRCS